MCVIDVEIQQNLKAYPIKIEIDSWHCIKTAKSVANSTWWTKVYHYSAMMQLVILFCSCVQSISTFPIKLISFWHSKNFAHFNVNFPLKGTVQFLWNAEKTWLKRLKNFHKRIKLFHVKILDSGKSIVN